MNLRNKLNAPNRLLQAAFPRLLSKPDCFRPCVIQSCYRLPTPANIYKVWIQQFDMLRQICESTWSSPELVKRNLFLSGCPAGALTSFRGEMSISHRSKLNYGGQVSACLFPHHTTVLPFLRALNLSGLYILSILT